MQLTCLLSIQPKNINIKYILIIFFFYVNSSYAAGPFNCTVNTTADAGGTACPGSLRQVINFINSNADVPGNTITLPTGSTVNVTLGDLPVILWGTTVTGTNSSIDGNGSRLLATSQAPLAVQNTTLTNGNAIGGSGSNFINTAPAGGGGLGAGGGIFIDAGQTLTLSNMGISSCTATGGAGANGAFGSTNPAGGGGGGASFSVGNKSTANSGGGGDRPGSSSFPSTPGAAVGYITNTGYNNGVVSPSMAGSAGSGTTGGAGGYCGGTGGNSITSGAGGGGGNGGGVGGTANLTTGGSGGGYNSGGSGASNTLAGSSGGGAGGFGGAGGGAGGTSAGNGGGGGFGGGGGGRRLSGTPGPGGTFGGVGGSDALSGGGGGGAGIGGAIFAGDGADVTFLNNISISGNSVVGGSGGANPLSGGTAGNGTGYAQDVFLFQHATATFSGATQTISFRIFGDPGAPSTNLDGGVVVNSAGVITLSGSNTFRGGATLNAGTLSIGSNSNFGSSTGQLTFGGGTLVVTGSLSTSGAVTLNQNAVIQPGNGATVTLSGVVANGTSGTDIIMNTNGTLVLAGTNTYTGSTGIQSGTVRISADENLGTAPGAPVANNITLFNGTLATNNSLGSFTLNSNRGIQLTTTGSIAVGSGTNLNYGGIISGAASLVADGLGTLTLSGASTYTGATSIEQGTVSISADNNLGAAPGVATPNHLQLESGTLATADSLGAIALNTNRGINLNSGSGTIAVGTGTTLTYGGILTASSNTIPFISDGAGTLVFTTANTYGGGVGGSTTINNGTLQINADNNLGVAPGSVQTGYLNFGAGTLAVGTGLGTVVLNANRGVSLNAGGGTFAVGTGTTLSYAGTISGSNSLTVNNSGTGVLLLGATNTTAFTGPTTIAGGRLQANITNIIAGSSALALTGATAIFDQNDNAQTVGDLSGIAGSQILLGNAGLTINQTTDQSFAGVINSTATSGTLTLSSNSTATLTLSGTNTYTGITTINAGAIRISSDQNLGVAPGSAQDGAITLGSASTSGTLATNDSLGAITLNANRNFALNAGGGGISVGTGTTLNYAGIIKGTGPLNLAGFGTFVPSATNTFSGATTISNGTVSISADNNLGDTGNTLAFNAGTLATTTGLTLASTRAITLNAGGGIFEPTDTLNYGGSIGGTGALTMNGSGTLALSLSSGTYTGGTNINNGTLNTNSIGSNTGPLRFGGGILVTNANLVTSGSVTLDQNADIRPNIGTSLTLNGIIANGSGGTAIVMNGAGTLFVNGANTYTGGTSINSGTVTIGSTTALGSGGITFGGGTLATTANTVISGGVNFATDQNGILQPAAGTTLTFSGNLVANGTNDLSLNGVNNTAILVLSGNNAHTGSTIVTSGTLQVASDANLGAASASLVLNGGIFAPTATFSTAKNISLTDSGIIQPAVSTTLTLNGNITQSGSRNLTMSGAGTLVLGGTNSYTGGTTITNGRLEANGSSLPSSGTVLITNGVFNLTGGSFPNVIFSNQASGTAIIAGAFSPAIGSINSGALNIDGVTFSIPVGFANLGGIYLVGVGSSLDGSLTNGSILSIGEDSFNNFSLTTFTPTLNSTISGVGTIQVGGGGLASSFTTNAGSTVTGVNSAFTIANAATVTLNDNFTGTATSSNSNNSGTLNIAAGFGLTSFTNNSDGVINFSGGSAVNTTSIINNGTLNITGATTSTAPALVTNNQTMALSANLSGTGSLTNNSTINIATGGNLALSGGITNANAGVINVAGTFTPNTIVSNEGTINVNAGGNISGALTGGAGSVLNIGNTSAVTFNSNSSVDGIRSVNLVTNGTVLNVNAAMSNVNTTFNVATNTTANINSSLTGTGTFVNNATTTISATGAINLTGGFTNPSGANLNIAGTFTPNTITSNAGNINVNDNGVINGPLSGTVGAMLNIGNASAANFTNTNTIDSIPQINLVTSGTIYNLNAAVTNVTTSLTVANNTTLNINNTLSGNGSLANAGTVNLNSGGTINQASGIVNVATGNINIAIGYTPVGTVLNTGAINVNSSGTLNVTANVNNTGGTITTNGTGILNVANALNGIVTNAGVCNVTSNFTPANTSANTGVMNINAGGTFTQPATFTYSGTINANTGTPFANAIVGDATNAVLNIGNSTSVNYATTNTVSDVATINLVASGTILTVNNSISGINTAFNVASGTTANIAASVTGAGNATNSGNVTLSSSLGLNNFTNQSGAVLTFALGANNNTNITNNAGGIFNISGNSTNTADIINSGNMSVTASLASGTITNTSGGVLTFNGATNEDDVINQAGGTFNISGNSTNNAAVSNAGTMNVLANLIGTGTITNTTGGVIALNSNVDLLNTLNNNAGGVVNITGANNNTADVSNSGTMNFTITNVATFDAFTASGNVDLNAGSTINVSSLFSSTTTNFTNTWNIITSPSLTDNGATINIPSNMGMDQWTYNISGTTLSITYLRTSGFTANTPLTQMLEKVMDAMAENVTNPGQAALVSVFNSITTQEQYLYFLNNLVPNTNVNAINVQMQNTLFNKIGTRVRGIKNTKNRIASLGGYTAGDIDRNTSMWLSGFGNIAKQQEDDLNFGYRMRMSGFLIGIDRRASEYNIIGVAAGISNNNVYELFNEQHTSRILSFNGALYGSHAYGSNNFTEWMVVGGVNKNNTRRVFSVNGVDLSTQGSYRNSQAGWRLNLGKNYSATKYINLSILGSGQYVWLYNPKYNEDYSIAALNVKGKTNSSVATIGSGFRASLSKDPWFCGNNELLAVVTYDVLRPNNLTTASFVVGSNDFFINGTNARLALNLGANCGVNIFRNLQIQFNYNYQIRSGYYDHFGQCMLRYLF